MIRDEQFPGRKSTRFTQMIMFVQMYCIFGWMKTKDRLSTDLRERLFFFFFARVGFEGALFFVIKHVFNTLSEFLRDSDKGNRWI